MIITKLDQHLSVRTVNKEIVFKSLNFTEAFIVIELSPNDTLAVFRDGFTLRIISNEDGSVFDVYSNNPISLTTDKSGKPFISILNREGVVHENA